MLASPLTACSMAIAPSPAPLHLCWNREPEVTDTADPQSAELTFDAALEHLEQLARQLENGDIPLEDALEVYERAVGLFRHCRDRLEGVEQRLEKLTRDLDGDPVTAAMAADDHEDLDG